MPVRLQCPACSAPLTVPDERATTTKCPYCGAGVLLTERHGRVEAAVAAPPRQSASRTPLLIGCAAALVAAAIGAGALLATRGGDPPAEPASAPTAAPVAAAEPPAPAGPPPFADTVLAFGSEGTGPGRFTDARAVAVDGEGRIYVGEYSGGKVQVFDSAGTFLTQWTADPEMPLLDLEADRRGTVYVVQSGRIRRFEGATGKPLGTLPGGGTRTVNDVALAPDGTLWVTAWPHEIVHLSGDGRVLRTIDARETIGGDASPARVAVSGSGDLYVLDQWARDVFHLDRTGRFVDRFAREAENGAQPAPHDVVVDGRGRVLVGDAGGVFAYSAEGRFLGEFGGGVVFGIAVTDRDEVIAADRNRYKVVKFRLRE